MISFFDHPSDKGGRSFDLNENQHESIMLILNKICAQRPQRPLCKISTRLLQELQAGKIAAKFMPADNEDTFDLLHLYHPVGPVQKAILQLYAWIDGQDMYCIGIGTGDEESIALEHLRDPAAYLIGHKLFMEMLTRVKDAEPQE